MFFLKPPMTLGFVGYHPCVLTTNNKLRIMLYLVTKSQIVKTKCFCRNPVKISSIKVFNNILKMIKMFPANKCTGLEH